MEIEVHGDIYDVDTKRDASIDESDLAGELLKLPSLVELYNRLQGLTHAQIAKNKADQEKMWAILDRKVRESFRAAKYKFTEAVVKNEVLLQEPYQNLKKEEIGLLETVGILKSVCQALWTKQECLKELLKGEYRSSYSPRVKDSEVGNGVSLEDVRHTVKKG